MKSKPSGLLNQALRYRDAVAGGILAIASFVTLVWLIPHSIEQTDAQGGMSPRFVPQLAFVVVLVLSLLLVIGDVLSKIERKPVKTSAIGQTLAWACISLFIWLGLDIIGFLPTAVLGMLVLTLLSGFRLVEGIKSYAVLIGVSVLVPVAITFLSRFAFSIQLP